MQCRREHATIQAASSNISDVGKKLDVVIKFMDTMNSRLVDMDGKLSAIQAGVTALHEDMKRVLINGRASERAVALLDQLECDILHQSPPGGKCAPNVEPGADGVGGVN